MPVSTQGTVSSGLLGGSKKPLIPKGLDPVLARMCTEVRMGKASLLDGFTLSENSDAPSIEGRSLCHHPPPPGGFCHCVNQQNTLEVTLVTESPRL